MTNKPLIIGIVVTIIFILCFLKFNEVRENNENYDKEIVVASVPEKITTSCGLANDAPPIHMNHDEELEYSGLQSGVRNNFGPSSIYEPVAIGVNLRCPYLTTNPELINAFPHAGNAQFYGYDGVSY